MLKKIVPNVFDKEKYVIHYKNLHLFLRLALKLKTNISFIRIQSISMAKTICWVQHAKKNRSRKENGDKDGKTLHKLINNDVYGKMEKLRNRIDVTLVSNKKDYLKWTSKKGYMPHKIFGNDLVTIRKNA